MAPNNKEKLAPKVKPFHLRRVVSPPVKSGSIFPEYTSMSVYSFTPFNKGAPSSPFKMLPWASSWNRRLNSGLPSTELSLLKSYDQKLERANPSFSTLSEEPEM